MVTELTDRDTRHLVAVNADIVGFSRLMADDAAGTEETVEDFRSLVEAQVEAASGTLVNFVGDNFMAVFDDATDAIGAAIAISAEVEARNAELPRHRWVRFRMGIDQGEVTSTADRYFGDALNIAARIQEKAPPGGVSVSGRVFEALDEPALRFRPVGRLALKNIPEPVDIFEFADLPGDGAAPSRGLPAAVARRADARRTPHPRRDGGREGPGDRRGDPLGPAPPVDDDVAPQRGRRRGGRARRPGPCPVHGGDRGARGRRPGEGLRQGHPRGHDERGHLTQVGDHGRWAVRPHRHHQRRDRAWGRHRDRHR